MLLAIDIGNTNIVFGVYDGDKLIFDSRVDTNRHRMADQYAVILAQIFELYNIPREQVSGAVISSVVPPVSDQLKLAVKRIFGVMPMMVGAGLKTGLNILIDDPSTLGADLACGAAAARACYPLPCIVIDVGTATKVFAIDKNGALLGGIIAPGIKISLEALTSRTVSLPLISLDGESPVIGTNTVDSMRSGVMYGAAGMLDNFVERFQEEIGEATVVATGGFSELVQPYCRSSFIINKTLVLDGARIIYEKNVNRHSRKKA